ncbi:MULTISPECIES: c-type cytochrome [unclassified Thioalkalivibrio]|uniref:c-type cytochrome n=1 Tax=unclassified Thioalkalivibrio TaxID=2621013 RepID=UPI000377E5A2|nr:MULTISPECIES: c-type cytochrome [unclassified Thioalkalivibrio]
MPTTARLLPAALLALFALTACSDAPEPDTAAEPPAQASGEDSSAASGSTAQLDYSLPPEDFAADPEAGRSLFRANCMQCHGEDARGTDQGPPLIHRIYEPSHHPDITFHRAVALGVHAHHWDFGDMPPVAGVTGEETAHIIAWIRQEQRAVGID